MSEVQVPKLPPHCVPGRKSKVAAGLLAFFLGALGIQHFYLGAWGTGLLYLFVVFPLSIATMGVIGIIVSLVDAIRLWTMDDTTFTRKYCCGDVSALEFTF